MPKCEWCGKSYDKSDAESIFSMGTFCLSYANVRKNLCGECAIQAIEDEVDGIYYEICEE